MLMHIMPGDQFALYGEHVPAEIKARWAASRGTDQPVAVQYARWLRDIASGYLGWSQSRHASVATVILGVVPNTMLLMALAFTSSLVLGVAIGAWQGARARSPGDRIVTAASLLLYSTPEFFLGLLLSAVFAYRLHIFPANGMSSVEASYQSLPDRMWDVARHLVLPWLSLTLVGTAVFARFQRAAMEERIAEPFVRTARAKGLSERAVRGHALRASLIPVVTLAGVLLPTLLTGAVLVEQIFAWPGLGLEFVRAVNTHDYDLVAGIAIVGSAMTVVGSMLADVGRAIIDPRLRHS